MTSTLRSVLFQNYFFLILLISVGISSCSAQPVNGDSDEVDGQPLSELDLKRTLKPNPEPTVFVNVALLPMDKRTILKNQDVYIREGSIEQITATSASSDYTGYRTIDGGGKYLVPGFSNMHVHLLGSYYENLTKDLFIYLAHGVTTVRVMWGSEYQVALRDSIDRGFKLGPRLLVASPGFDGNRGAWPGAVLTNTQEEVREKVREIKLKGYDFIKIYSGLSSEEYFALLDEASLNSIPAVGHIPFSVSINEVLANRQYSISHMQRYATWINPVTDWAALEAMAQQTAAEGTWNCPTLAVVNRTTGQINDYKNSFEMQHMSPQYESFMTIPPTQPVVADASLMHEQRLRFLGMLNEAGSGVLACTDTGLRYVFPGFSLQEELEYYLDAGMDPFEVLETATANVSRHLNDHSTGIIKEGSRADLILLNQNPLNNLSAIDDRAGVMAGGTWFSGDKISQLLHAIRSSYKR